MASATAAVPCCGAQHTPLLLLFCKVSFSHSYAHVVSYTVRQHWAQHFYSFYLSHQSNRANQLITRNCVLCRLFTCMACVLSSAGSCDTSLVCVMASCKPMVCTGCTAGSLEQCFCLAFVESCACLPGPTPSWLLGGMPLIRKHGGVAFASQALSRLYGPVWVFNFFTSNSMVFTVRLTCGITIYVLAMRMHESLEKVFGCTSPEAPPNGT